MAAMEQVTIIIAILSFICLGLSLWQTSKLATLAANSPGIGRILFFSQISLKVWAAMVLPYLVVNTSFPDWSRGHENFQLGVRLILGVYLIVQPIVVNVALWRWKRKGNSGY